MRGGSADSVGAAVAAASQSLRAPDDAQHGGGHSAAHAHEGEDDCERADGGSRGAVAAKDALRLAAPRAISLYLDVQPVRQEAAHDATSPTLARRLNAAATAAHAAAYAAAGGGMRRGDDGGYDAHSDDGGALT